MNKRLYRSRDDKFIVGLCGGIANYFKVDSTIIRIVFAVLAFSSIGMGFLIYVIAAIIVPERPEGYRDIDEEEMTGSQGDGEKEGGTYEVNTKQTLGLILVAAGGLILMSRLVGWFDSQMILAIGIIAVGGFVLFKKNG